MKYEVWDSVSYGHMEPLVPFTKLFESEILTDVVNFIENKGMKQMLFVCSVDGNILFRNTDFIYESPNGETVYKRSVLSNKKQKIN